MKMHDLKNVSRKNGDRSCFTIGLSRTIEGRGYFALEPDNAAKTPKPI
jgi:hypothetical protein